MNENEIIKTAQMMFLQNKGRKEVIDFLLDNGIDKDSVDSIATDAFKAIQDERKKMMEEQETEVSKEMNKSLIIGVLFLIGGIIATLTTDRIWYGAMGVGVITMINGMRK